MTDRTPLTGLPKGARVEALHARGLDSDLLPITLTTAERKAAMDPGTPAPLVVSPTGTPWLPPWVSTVGVVLVGIAAVVMAIPGIPPAVVTVCTVVVALGAALGIASPGVRKADAPKP